MTEQRNLNVELLIKLLKMTTSSNDQEALAFMRKANEHLEKNKWTWEEILRGKISVAADPFMSAPIPQAKAYAATPHVPPQAPVYYSRAYTTQPPPPRQRAPKPPKPKRADLTLEDLGL